MFITKLLDRFPLHAKPL